MPRPRSHNTCFYDPDADPGAGPDADPDADPDSDPDDGGPEDHGDPYFVFWGRGVQPFTWVCVRVVFPDAGLPLGPPLYTRR